MRKKISKLRTQLTVETIADGGVGLARDEGKIIFIEKGIPGDIVDVQITKKRSDFEQAVIKNFHQHSPLRIDAFCTHFGTCGGCKWQNIEYETQLKFKHQLVSDAFRRIGKFSILPEILPIIASPFDRYYRNKLEFTFSNKRWLLDHEKDQENIEQTNAVGFHIQGRFDKILNIDYCYLQPAPSNEIRLAARAYALIHQIPFYDLRTHEGIFRSVIIRTTLQQDVMMIATFGKNIPEIILPFMQHMVQTFPEITSAYFSINEKVNDYLYDLEMQLYSGNKFIVEQIEEIKYHLGPKSFFQTNPEQAKTLYAKTLQLAALTKEDIVYDFYTGLGSIALLASKHCHQVIGVENVEAAIEDAKLNATLNGITNCTFICGDMAKIFTDDFVVQHGKAHVVITDPPRSGMHKDVCDQLLKLEAKKIVYVSCNPVTQARDIQLLSEKYDVVSLQPVDMFPQTYHVENIVLLELKKI